MLMGIFCLIWLEWFHWFYDFFFFCVGMVSVHEEYSIISSNTLFHSLLKFLIGCSLYFYWLWSSNFALVWWVFRLFLFIYWIVLRPFFLFCQAQVLLGPLFVFSWTHVAEALIKNYFKIWKNMVWRTKERLFLVYVPIDLKWGFPSDKVSSKSIWRNLFLEDSNLFYLSIII